MASSPRIGLARGAAGRMSDANRIACCLLNLFSGPGVGRRPRVDCGGGLLGSAKCRFCLVFALAVADLRTTYPPPNPQHIVVQTVVGTNSSDGFRCRQGAFGDYFFPWRFRPLAGLPAKVLSGTDYAREARRRAQSKNGPGSVLRPGAISLWPARSRSP